MLSCSLRVASVFSGAVALCVAMLLFAAPAFARPPATHSMAVGSGTVHATRAEVKASVELSNEEVGEVKYRFEYATSGEGPWTIARSGSYTFTEVDHEHLQVVSAELHHLTPGTTYHVRAVASDQGGESEQELELTTTAVAAPELYCYAQLGEPGCTAGEYGEKPIKYGRAEAAAYALNFKTRIESNGAETEYSVEYGTSPTGPWTSIEAGKITVAQDFLELEKTLTGLEAEKTYYVHVSAKNAKGKIEETERFTTEQASVGDASLYGGLKQVSASSAVFDFGFNPRSSESHWRLEYITAKSLEEGGAWLKGPEGVVTAAEATENALELEAELTGLDPGTAYDARVFTENTHPPGKTGSAVTFETAGPPFAETFAVHSFDGESLRMLGSVVPHGLDTHYRFQYVTQRHFEAEGFANPDETSQLDAGGSGAETIFLTRIVGADLPAAAVGESYRYRLVASNAASLGSETAGATQSLTVAAAGGGEEGAGASQPGTCSNEPLRTGTPSASLPDCRAYEQVTPVEKAGAKDIFRYGVADESVILGEDGEHVIFSGAGVQWGSSPDPTDSTYIFSRQEGSGWKLTPARPEGEVEGRSYGEPAVWGPDLTNLAFDHVGWATSGNESKDVEVRIGPSGGPYATIATLPRSEAPNPTVPAGAPEVGVYVISTSDRTLVPGHVSATTSGDDLYEYAGGGLRQLNVTGENTSIGRCGAEIVPPRASEGSVNSPPDAVSADGSRIFFEAVPGSNCSEAPRLYMRSDDSETLEIGAYSFVAANPEGSEVVLERDNAGVYEYLLYNTETRILKLLFSAPEAVSLVVCKDFDAIYFRSVAKLTSEAPELSADSGERPVDYYRYDIPSGSLRFTFQASYPESAEFASPEGRYLYFRSPAVGGAGVAHASVDQQVYRYDDSAHVVQCVSCASSFDPRPELSSRFTPGLEHVRRGAWNLPASQNGDFVFFDAESALVPQDVDGEIPNELERGSTAEFFSEGSEELTPSSDVYEWRKDGIDGCQMLQGCLALISSGTGGLENVFLGTDPSGRDVFFATHSQLAPSDTDASGDIYDARIGGGFPVAPPGATECEGDACASTVSPPLAVTPASFVFSGAGNLPPSVQAPPSTAKTSKSKAKKHKARTKPKKATKRSRKARKSAERGRR
jgi:hypothetical protein